MERRGDDGAFCRAYLRTMDPDRAAAETGREDGFALLRSKAVGERLEEMRAGAAEQVRREDAVRQLAQLAFGRANDAVKLALHAGEIDPEGLDLSAVAEFKVTDRGGVEVKLADRVRALEALCRLLEDAGGRGAAALYQALAEGCGGREEDWEHG